MTDQHDPAAPTARPIARHVAAQVRTLRREKQLSGAQLAQRVNDIADLAWDRNTLAKLELGYRQNLTVDELVALAAALGVPAASLLPTGERGRNSADVLADVIMTLTGLRYTQMQKDGEA